MNRVQIAFTKSDLIFSKLIRGVTKEDISHCIIIVDDFWVVHSNFKGVHTEYIGSFLEKNQIVTRLNTDISVDRVYDLLKRHDGEDYDLGGMIYMGLALSARRVCPRCIPKQNLWQSSSMNLCTELVLDLVDRVDHLTTPGQLRTILKEEFNYAEANTP